MVTFRKMRCTCHNGGELSVGNIVLGRLRNTTMPAQWANAALEADVDAVGALQDGPLSFC